MTLKNAVRLLVTSYLLSGCSGHIDNSNTISGNSTYPQSATFYQTQAANSDNEAQQQAFQLKMAGRLIQDGQLSAAQQKLNAISPVSSELKNEKYLLEAKQALLKQQSRKALQLAAKVSDIEQMEPGLQAFYHELLASSYHLSGRTINEVSQLILLDDLQNSPQAKLATRRSIWQALSTVPLPQEKALVLESKAELSAWLALNIAVRDNQDNGKGLIEAVQAWQKTYPTHAANSILSMRKQPLQPEFKNIALLLPLTGELSGPGQAVRDGFMAAYFEAKQKGVVVKFYDTNKDSIVPLYNKAIATGADLVIGPLTKQNVEALAQTNITVPTIALNDIDMAVSPNFYQFSIDPQNEAAQLASKVYNDGLRRVLVIAPKGHWGESIAQTFSNTWQKLGGNLAELFYFDETTDMNQGIRQLLDISDSHDRKNNLVRTIWKRPQFYPRRRQDFDGVILLSYASKARQIRPLLKFYYAGDVPVYGTSLLYSGTPNPQYDADLNGIVFGEMPYMLKNKANLITKPWPEQLNNYNRLYAMGKDAFLLGKRLNQLKLFPMLGSLNNSGTLFIDNKGQITRQLAWAKFKNGVVQPL